MKRVYLAGPISGLSYGAACNWRDEATAYLGARGIEALSPMGGKEYLKDVSKFLDAVDYGTMGPLSGDRAITTRDRFFATTCDVLLVNLLGAEKVSIGTVLEIAWADAKRIPIVIAMEKKGNPHEHGMIRELAGFRAQTLDEALWITARVLNAPEPR